MNPAWQTFLQQQGALVQSNIVQHFGDLPLGNLSDELAATQTQTVLCDLSQFGSLKVSGADAQSFLQNLLSSDVSAVNVQHAQLSSLNSPKGRMIASFLIWQNGADYYLQLPANLCAAIQKKLSMYVLRAKVKIEDASTLIVSLGMAGEHAAILLQQHFGDLPPSDFGAQQFDHGNIIRLGAQRFQINIAATHAIELWQKLSTNSQSASPQIVGSPCWDWLQIRAGIPVILPATQEQFVAQMVNLELIGGVSFKKGCYPGQEIVARMQYLGKLKRRMYLAHIETTDNPTPQAQDIPEAGDELFSTDMEEQSCGMIVNAAPAPGGGYDVLAVVQISSQAAQTVHWRSLQGATLEFMSLPYSLEK